MSESSGEWRRLWHEIVQEAKESINQENDEQGQAAPILEIHGHETKTYQ